MIGEEEERERGRKERIDEQFEKANTVWDVYKT